MSRRTRKKWLKQHNKYVNPKEVWNLDVTFAEFAIPRLKMLKENHMGYPGKGEMDTPEKWDAALDKMINAFELHLKMIDLDDSLEYFDRSGGDGKWKANMNKIEADEAIVKEGLHLFAEWYGSLWD